MIAILGALLGILLFALELGLGSLIFWVLGLLVVKVFGIAYIWTFWHGLVCELVFIVLRAIFNNK